MRIDYLRHQASLLARGILKRVAAPLGRIVQGTAFDAAPHVGAIPVILGPMAESDVLPRLERALAILATCDPVSHASVTSQIKGIILDAKPKYMPAGVNEDLGLVTLYGEDVRWKHPLGSAVALVYAATWLRAWKAAGRPVWVRSASRDRIWRLALRRIWYFMERVAPTSRGDPLMTEELRTSIMKTLEQSSRTRGL